MTVKKYLKKKAYQAKKHSPEIFLGISIVGIISIPVLSAIGTVKAINKVDDYVDTLEEDEAPDKKELVKQVAPCYIWTGVATSVTLFSVVKTKKILDGRSAAVLSLLMSERKSKKILIDKMKEKFGEAKTTDVLTEARIEEHKQNIDEDEQFINGCKVIETGLGDTLFFDKETATYFRCSLDAIDKAVNDINRKLTTKDIYASLNDFLELINLPWMGLADNIGWVQFDEPLTVEKDFTVYKGEPIVILSYQPYPLYNFMASEF